MDDPVSWVNYRVAAAVKAATTDTHAFPEAVPAQLQMLLSEQFQEPLKSADLDSIATELIATNRGEQ